VRKLQGNAAENRHCGAAAKWLERVPPHADAPERIAAVIARRPEPGLAFQRFADFLDRFGPRAPMPLAVAAFS
jgi:ferric-dicitrate binding protein FerR (iron transport regulator)